MHFRQPNESVQVALDEMLGYLNFSSGKPDPRFQQRVNEVFAWLAEAGEAPWQGLPRLLSQRLEELKTSSATFAQAEQARAVLRWTFDELLPAYREFHRDLLFHQPPDVLFGPFFLARACEAVLAQGALLEATAPVVEAALARLNQFVGHRPVATLETEQRLAPYAHEYVAPIPLYLAGAGVAVGRYQELLTQALDILRSTDEHLLMQAYFDPALLDELALDPRAYDFYHPVNRRPNYQFGQWDPHHVDNQSRYRRFVLQQVTLDTLLERFDEPTGLPREEVLYEAAAVLAGTILMASGVSGSGPDTHDSDTSLATLMPRIAAYRDEFYISLLARLTGPHGDRLRAEAESLRQPFAATRQHLNSRLVRLRAAQLEHVHLAQIFARMGYPEASLRQAHVVPVASGRMLCEIKCSVTEAHRAIDRGQLDEAAARLPQIEDLVQRGIQCGALVDPWNILGFQGQFSIFVAMENSVRDHRVDQLIRIVERIFDLHARLHRAASAAGASEMRQNVEQNFRRLADWWDRFATLEVSGVRPVSGEEAVQSADHVSAALVAWRAAGEEAGDIAFWRKHVEPFTTPKAFALVVEVLLDKGDLVAAMALLMQWLNQAEPVAIDEGEVAFHELTLGWMHRATRRDDPAADPQDGWRMLTKFFDYLEANAEEYWDVPEFEWSEDDEELTTMLDEMDLEDELELEDDEEDEDENLFGAAYEGMTFHDSTDDGFESDMLESGGFPTEFELDFEAERLGDRLAFLSTVARLWKSAAVGPLSQTLAEQDALEERDAAISGWLRQALNNRRQLLTLLTAVHRYRIPAASGTREALLEYDRRRVIQQALLNRIVDTYVVTSDTARWLASCLPPSPHLEGLEAWERLAAEVLRAMSQADVARLKSELPRLRDLLLEQPLLYIPLARKGNPRRKAAAQNLQRMLRQLLAGLPRLGLLDETLMLVDTAQEMEQRHPVGDGAVTEFNRLFQLGLTAVIEALVQATCTTTSLGTEAEAGGDQELLDCLEIVTEALLKRWLRHSRSARISVLERVATEDRWAALRQFIENYGDDLFTQKFLNLGNLRAILHQGVDVYLRRMEEEPNDEPTWKLLEDLDVRIPRTAATAHLELVLETIIENYPEYEDYNTSTTQSDRGGALYMLLDFLRLKASYERVSWNLKPVVLAHETLIRRGRTGAAEQWFQSMTEKTSEVAEWHLTRLAELTRKYGMRLASVSDRLGERFVRPLVLDRIRALVRPAIEEARRRQPAGAFDQLERQVDEFARVPSGSGLDVPPWLISLEQEVEDVVHQDRAALRQGDEDPPVPRVQLDLATLREQVETWNDPPEA